MVLARVAESRSLERATVRFDTLLLTLAVVRLSVNCYAISAEPIKDL